MAEDRKCADTGTKGETMIVDAKHAKPNYDQTKYPRRISP